MENKVNDGSGSGFGSGSGDGYGYGDGYGSGDGFGYGDGYGSGSGSGDGYGYGDGYGSGSGYGYGDGGEKTRKGDRGMYAIRKTNGQWWTGECWGVKEARETYSESEVPWLLNDIDGTLLVEEGRLYYSNDSTPVASVVEI